MRSRFLTVAALIAASVAPETGMAANGIGNVTGTSSPEVVTPPLIGPTPTPSYLAPPIALPDSNFVVTPKGTTFVPRSPAAVKPHW